MSHCSLAVSAWAVAQVRAVRHGGGCVPALVVRPAGRIRQQIHNLCAEPGDGWTHTAWECAQELLQWRMRSAERTLSGHFLSPESRSGDRAGFLALNHTGTTGRSWHAGPHARPGHRCGPCDRPGHGGDPDRTGARGGGYGPGRHVAAGPPVDRILSLDVSDDASVAAAVEAAGELDAVVNNAGRTGSGPLEDYPLDDFARVLDVNTLGPLRMAQAVGHSGGAGAVVGCWST